MNELDMFNYEKNINVTATPNKDVVITMNKEIFMQMVNAIYDGADYHREAGRPATAKSIMRIWKALNQ